MQGLRVDGRRPLELRRFNCRVGVFSQADGSAYVEQGNTKCLAAVYGPREPLKRTLQLFDKAYINVEFNMASFSTGEHKNRQRKDRRMQDVETAIQRIFESVIITSQFPRAQIDIYLQILQMDGGSLHAAINAASLAVIDAGIPMTDYVCACSAGFANDTTILDLNYIEESADVPFVTVALMPKSGGMNMVEMESRLHVDHLDSVIQLASEGCQQLVQILDEQVRKSTEQLSKTVLPM